LARRRLADLHDDVLATDHLAKDWMLRLRQIGSPPTCERT
jgi:hypothetical protein